MKSIIISTVLLVALGAVALYLATTRFDTFLKLKAMGDCEMSSQYQVTKDGVTVSYPAEEVYKQCLKNKGY